MVAVRHLRFVLRLLKTTDKEQLVNSIVVQCSFEDEIASCDVMRVWLAIAYSHPISGVFGIK